MIKYQVFENDRMILDNATITEAYSKVEAGSKIISGNTVRKVRHADGSETEEILEIKSTHKAAGSSKKITIVQICE